MILYLLRRLGFLVLTLVLTSILIFVITQWLPGDVGCPMTKPAEPSPAGWRPGSGSRGTSVASGPKPKRSVRGSPRRATASPCSPAHRKAPSPEPTLESSSTPTCGALTQRPTLALVGSWPPSPRTD